MRGRETRGAPNSTDLLVCFPSRAHLTLMPKSISSPARPSETNQRHHGHHRNYHNQQHLRLKKLPRGGGQGGSPLLWAKTKSMGAEIEEPTSPKVTCAGQIRVRPKTATSCKNWQSVMEEIERIHSKARKKKKPSWMEALGLKKEVMQFLTCMRSLRLDFRCFGSFPATDITSDDDEEDLEEEEEEEEKYHENVHEEENDSETSSTVFSKWFMVLQENQNNQFRAADQDHKEKKHEASDNDDDDDDQEVSVPPPNALLLMRCLSAPAKSWLEEKAEEENEQQEDGDDEDEAEKFEENKKDDSLILMRYDTEYYKISSDIAKETWVVGGTRDLFSRSRSWKR